LHTAVFICYFPAFGRCEPPVPRVKSATSLVFPQVYLSERILKFFADRARKTRVELHFRPRVNHRMVRFLLALEAARGG